MAVDGWAVTFGGARRLYQKKPSINGYDRVWMCGSVPCTVCIVSYVTEVTWCCLVQVADRNVVDDVQRHCRVLA